MSEIKRLAPEEILDEINELEKELDSLEQLHKSEVKSYLDKRQKVNLEINKKDKEFIKMLGRSYRDSPRAYGEDYV